MVLITPHAWKRIRERFGWSDPQAQRLADHARLYGQCMVSQRTGRKRRLVWRYHAHWVFEGNAVVTVLQPHHHL